MPKYVAPLLRLRVRRLFHLSDFRFNRFYQLCELFLAFLSCLGVYVLGYAFTAHSRREPPLVEVVVYHRHATRTTLSYLRCVGLKFLLRRGFCGGVTYALRKFGHLRVCTAAHAIHDMQVIGFGEAAPLAVVQSAQSLSLAEMEERSVIATFSKPN